MPKGKRKTSVEMVEQPMYQVTLPGNFAGSHRQRAGIFVPTGPQGYVGTLTPEQREAIEGDSVLTLRDYRVS